MTKQAFTQKKFVPGSSRSSRSARTVLLHMAADQERADRIRALKQDHPEYTWDAIADHVGVSPRAAQAWQEKGGITYENAKRLAALWGEDLDYIMRGARSGAPDLMGALVDESQLDRIEEMLTEVLALLRGETVAGASVHRIVTAALGAADPDATRPAPGGTAGRSGAKRGARKAPARGTRKAG